MGVWLVTGCSSGIGMGVARAALDAGEQVVATARDVSSLDGLVREFPQACGTARLDVTREDDVEAAVRLAEERFGGVDVLVNNAGAGYRAAVEESDPAEVRRLFAVNVDGPLALIQAVLPGMRQKGAGAIVNVTSIGGVRGAPCNGMYSAAKGALELMTDALRKECVPFGISVMAVEPGAFRTSFYSSLAGRAEGISAYDSTVGQWRVGAAEVRHDQAGDPVRAGKAIASVVLGGGMPARLPLGSDAVDIVRGEYESRLAELAEWEDVSRSTDFPV